MASAASTPGTQRPGGRTARTREAALRAVLEELVERGYRDLSVEGVALRSGVHKTTLYRRWGSADALLGEAAIMAMDEAVPIPDTGALIDDLTELATLIAENLRRPITQALVRLVAAEGNHQPGLREASASFWRHRAELTKAVIDRAVAREELSAGTSATATLEALIAPLYLRLLVTGSPLDRAAIRTAADMTALAARQGLLAFPDRSSPPRERRASP